MTKRKRQVESEKPKYVDVGDWIEGALRYAADKLSRFLCVCGGSSPEVLDHIQNKHEKIKHTMFGAAVLVPSLFGVLTGANAVSKVFPSPLTYLSLGLLWGATIFVIDRLILTSMQHPFGLADRNWQGLARQAITTTLRLAIGFVLAMVIATPLNLAIFRKEINQELHERQHVTVAEKNAAILKSVEERITNVKQELVTIKDDNAIDGEAIGAAEKAIEEEFSGAAPSKLPGTGKRYNDKSQFVADLKERLQPAMNQRNGRLGQLNEQLRILDAQMQQAQGSVNTSQLTAISAQPTESYSLLESIEGLARLKSKSSTAWWVVVSIELLFLLIELTPITAKLISGAGLYEQEVSASQYPHFARGQLLRKTYRLLLKEDESRFQPVVNRLWATFAGGILTGGSKPVPIGQLYRGEAEPTKSASGDHGETKSHSNGNGHSTEGRARIDLAGSGGTLFKGKTFVATAPHDPPARPDTRDQVKAARDMLKMELDKLGVHYVPGGTVRLAVNGQPEGVFADIYMIHKGREGVLTIGEDDGNISWPAERLSEITTAFENGGVLVTRCGVNECLLNPTVVVKEFLKVLGLKPPKSNSY